jgi:hypothetical protein
MMKQGGLFCFVMMTSPKPWRFMSGSWYLWKALDEYGVMHSLGLRLFGAATAWKLLNIEPFSKRKLNKIKTENCVLELGSVLGRL